MEQKTLKIFIPTNFEKSPKLYYEIKFQIYKNGSNFEVKKAFAIHSQLATNILVTLKVLTCLQPEVSKPE